MPPPIDMNRFDQLRTSGDLPSPKGVALAVIRLTRQTDVSIGELARVISGDPALVGRLVKAANGLVALSRRPVASVPEALMVLGLPAVRTMVLGFSLLSDYRSGGCAAFDYDAFWNGSLATGLGLQVIAERARMAAPDELFSLGLLSRVGELALATLYPVDYAQVLSTAHGESGRPLDELEQEAFALTSRELTRSMLIDWGLPGVFIEAVRLAGTPAAAEYPDNPRLRNLVFGVEAARAMADICLAPDAARASLLERLVDSAARLRIGADAVCEDGQRMARLWAEWGHLLQFSQPAAPDFAALRMARSDAGSAPVLDVSPLRAGPGDENDPEAPAVSSGLPRALIVDDEPRTRAFLRDVLEAAGFEVSEAEDGRIGIERALGVQPQVLVVDWRLGGMDGPELVRALRQTRVGQAIYVIQLGHRADDEHLVEAFEAGADDFIAKPVSPKVFAARLRAARRAVHVQKELEREHEEISYFASQLAVSNRRLKEAALTDALTGFPNRRYAIDRIEQEWAASNRWGRPLSCMIIDLDNFKQINDTYGHDVGDDVLRGAADALRAVLRGQDVVCRTGGDEFLAICPETDLVHALACAERLRAALEGLRVHSGDEILQIRASIGVATRASGMNDVDAFMKTADRGAYLAKERGRNCVATVQALDITVPDAHTPR